MEGVRNSLSGADGTRIGLLTAGSGHGLLLVHGGMGRLERWEPLWSALTDQWRVTAMDRRGRASSGDATPYRLSQEYEDITAVATRLAQEQGEPVDVFGHSYGATCTLGATAGGAPLRRIVLYEPPGPPTVAPGWVHRIDSLLAAGQAGRAMVSFLSEIIGLTGEQIADLRRAGGAHDVLAVVTATMSREAHALLDVDLAALAARVTCPTLLLSGSTSPQWAADITRQLSRALPRSESVILAGHGHEAIDTAPDLLVAALTGFLS